MKSIFFELGIDGKLLLAQGVNFLIILIVLTFVVYRPLLRLMRERQERIALGLEGAREAQKRLAQIEELKEEKLREADTKSLDKIRLAEREALKRGEEILNQSREKAEKILLQAEEISRRRSQEEFERLYGEAGGMVRQALIKTVELDPSNIDEKLVFEAVKSLKEKSL